MEKQKKAAEKGDFVAAAKAFVQNLTDEEISLMDDRGCRVYVRLRDDYEFLVSIGDPNNQAFHEWADRAVRGYSSAHTGGWGEGWQESKNTPKAYREVLLSELIHALQENLKLAIEQGSADRGQLQH